MTPYNSTCPTYARGTEDSDEATSVQRTRTKAWEEVRITMIQADTDAIVRVDCTTFCGTDLDILEGDLPR